MSLAAMSWAFKQTLKPTQKIVLLALADYADDENRCWPSMKTLAEKSSLTERAVRSAIRDLEDALFLTTEIRVRPNGSQTSNAYQLNIARGAERFSGAPSPAKGGPPSPGTTPPEPSIEPSVEIHPLPSQQQKIDEAFDAIWRVWPNAKGKQPALRAWRRLGWTKLNEVAPLIVAHARAFQDNTPPQFIPMLSTFLNQERWDDPVAVAADRGGRNPEPAARRGITIPPGHRAVWDDNGYIIGSEPVS